MSDPTQTPGTYNLYRIYLRSGVTLDCHAKDLVMFDGKPLLVDPIEQLWINASNTEAIARIYPLPEPPTFKLEP